jgi:hypothetical protein
VGHADTSRRIVRPRGRLHAHRETQRIVPRSSAHRIEVFSRYFGPIIRVRETLDDARRQDFVAELDATLNRFNKSADATLVVSADYLEVVMARK